MWHILCGLLIHRSFKNKNCNQGKAISLVTKSYDTEFFTEASSIGMIFVKNKGFKHSSFYLSPCDLKQLLIALGFVLFCLILTEWEEKESQQFKETQRKKAVSDNFMRANYNPHFQKKNEVGGHKLQINNENIIKDIKKDGL